MKKGKMVLLGEGTFEVGYVGHYFAGPNGSAKPTTDEAQAIAGKLVRLYAEVLPGKKR